MINEKNLLNKANAYFLAKEFGKAMFIYSQLSSLNRSNKEYLMYALFCDLSSEDEEKALSLFDYFCIAKEENLDEAILYVNNVLEAYSGDIDKMMGLLKDISDASVDSLDAIKYEDFKHLVKSRGSFRIAFEDIMFSTKVAIESRDDFFDFVFKLIENDFSTTAYSYLEGFNDYFTYDKKIEELYKLLEEKKLATNHK